MAINSTFYLNAVDLTTATSVYLDALLTNIAPDGFYSDGTISRQQSSGILLTEENCNCEGELSLAYRSDGEVVYTESLCQFLVPSNPFYVSGNIGCSISTGNIAYNSNGIPNDFFDGENKYYKIYISYCDVDSYSYLVQIGTGGQIGKITVVEVCPPPPPL